MSGALFDRIIGGCTGDSNAEELQADLLKYRRARSMNYVNGNWIDIQLIQSVRFDWMIVAGDVALHTANCEAAGGGMNYVNGTLFKQAYPVTLVGRSTDLLLDLID